MAADCCCNGWGCALVLLAGYAVQAFKMYLDHEAAKGNTYTKVS